MSYLNHTHDPRRRTAAITATVAIHAAIGVAVVTGLTVAGFRPLRTYDPIFEFPAPPPPPDPTPTRAPERQKEVTAYTPTEIRLPIDVPNDWTEETSPTGTTDTSWYPTGESTELPAPLPSPRPTFTPKRAVPSNRASAWITNDDYPRRALVDEAEGSAAYRLVIGTNGRVSSCELTTPTGNRALDDATCRLIANRARFEPATDESGAKVLGTYTGSVRWEIPD